MLKMRSGQGGGKVVFGIYSVWRRAVCGEGDESR